MKLLSNRWVVLGIGILCFFLLLADSINGYYVLQGAYRIYFVVTRGALAGLCLLFGIVGFFGE